MKDLSEESKNAFTAEVEIDDIEESFEQMNAYQVSRHTKVF